jgi:hypothetical protein
MCCPCDERQVYHEPNGRKILQSGGPAGRFNEMCTATPVAPAEQSSGWKWDWDPYSAQRCRAAGLDEIYL